MTYYALLSVSNKSGIVDFAEGLIRAGYTLISSGGTHAVIEAEGLPCLLYTSPSPRDRTRSRMPSSA